MKSYRNRMYLFLSFIMAVPFSIYLILCFIVYVKVITQAEDKPVYDPKPPIQLIVVSDTVGNYIMIHVEYKQVFNDSLFLGHSEILKIKSYANRRIDL